MTFRAAGEPVTEPAEVIEPTVASTSSATRNLFPPPRLVLGTKGKINVSTSAGSVQVFGFLLHLQTCYSYLRM